MINSSCLVCENKYKCQLLISGVKSCLEKHSIKTIVTEKIFPTKSRTSLCTWWSNSPISVIKRRVNQFQTVWPKIKLRCFCMHPNTLIALSGLTRTKLPASTWPQIHSTCFATLVDELEDAFICARRMISSLWKEDSFSASCSNHLSRMDFSNLSKRLTRGHRTCLKVLFFLSPGKQSSKIPALKLCFSMWLAKWCFGFTHCGP